jgi:hypothetical protein
VVAPHHTHARGALRQLPVTGANHSPTQAISPNQSIAPGTEHMRAVQAAPIASRSTPAHTAMARSGLICDLGDHL